MNTFREALRSGRTLIFGHRGASASAPMNTLPAFERAVALGADGIELDVRQTSDGALVVIHDDTVDTTTDGSGRVDSLTLAQLNELDAGAWFGPAFACVRIPTLESVFEAVGARLLINVELKAEHLRATGLEAAVAEAIARFRLHDRVLVSSFNPLALRRFHRLMPEVAIGFLHAPEEPFFLPALMMGQLHEARHPHHSMVNERYMAWAHR
jgi:glycerophosphoryl diester phosphodiesterase